MDLLPGAGLRPAPGSIRAHAAGDHGPEREETCPSSPDLRPIGSGREVLLGDTSVLLAAGNGKDHAHRACLRLLRHAEGPLLVPSPVLDEELPGPT